MYDPKKSSRFSLVTVKRQVRHHTSDLTSMHNDCCDRWTAWHRDKTGKTAGKNIHSFLQLGGMGYHVGRLTMVTHEQPPGQPTTESWEGPSWRYIFQHPLPPSSRVREDQSELSPDQKIFPNHLKYNYCSSTAGMERAWILNRDCRSADVKSWF